MAGTDLEITLEDITVNVSHPDKVLFPTAGLTKADLGRYYAQVAPTMLPHIRDRPITLVRHPQGIGAKGFFQKNTPDHYPDWIPRVELSKKGGVVRHAVVDHPAALVYFAQQNVITPHIGLAHVNDLGRPTLFAVDLDPSEDDFVQLRRVALGVRAALERAGLVAFVQLTGSKGLHVVAPLRGDVGWGDVRRFGRALATHLLEEFRHDLTTEFAKVDRDGRIYLDMGRNNYQATIAAPYGVRALEGGPVVTPIAWDELNEDGMSAQRYTMTTVLDRLAEHGDSWANMTASAKTLPAAG